MSEISQNYGSHLRNLGSSVTNIGFREKCLILMFLRIKFSIRIEKEFLNSDNFEISQKKLKFMAAILDFGL